MKGRLPREIVVPEFTANITVTGSSSYMSLTINGATVNGSGNYNVSVGDTISCYGRHATASIKVVVNGTTVASASTRAELNYDYTVTGDATITLSSSSITITEG